MSLKLMKQRIAKSGSTLREEQINDSRKALNELFYDSVAYNNNLVLYNTEKEIPLLMYDQKSSSNYGTTSNFVSEYYNQVNVGNIIYDKFHNETWLCVESYNVADTYHTGKLGKCLTILKWQDINGDIKEYPIIVTSASKYNNGENGNNVAVIGSDQLLIFTELNEDTKRIKRGTKFFIDEDKENPTVYTLTRLDTSLYSCNGVGMVSLIVTETPYTPTKEELELWVCDYTKPNEPSSAVPDSTEEIKKEYSEVNIVGERNIKVGKKRTYYVDFYDENGELLYVGNIAYEWNVESSFDIEIEKIDNKISLYVEDDSLIGEKAKIQILIDGIVVSEIVTKVESVF